MKKRKAVTRQQVRGELHSDISCPVKIVTATRVNLLVKPLDSVGHNGAQPSQCGDTIVRMSECPHCCQTSSELHICGQLLTLGWDCSVFSLRVVICDV